MQRLTQCVMTAVQFARLSIAWVRDRRLSPSSIAACALVGLMFSLADPAHLQAQISQVDADSFTSTGNQVTDVPAYNVSAGANVLVVNLSWRTPTQQSLAAPPVVTYNGVQLNIASLASDNNANYSDSAILYLFNPGSGAHDLNVNFGGGLVGGSLASFDAFTLGGVDTNQAPETIAGHNPSVANDGPDVLSLAFSGVTYGSWANVAANYRQGGNGTTQGLTAAVTSGTGTLRTNGTGGTPANGNLYDQIVDTQLISAGALASNILSPNLTVQETGPGSANHRFTLSGAVFAPLRGSSTWTGGSATTNNWTDAANWGGTAPVAFSNLTFAGSARTNAVNDTPAATNYSSLTFDSTAASFTLSGNSIGMVGDIVNNSSNTQNINFGVNVGFDINLNAASGNIAIGGSLSGSNAITLNGPNTVSLNAANTNSGTVNVNNGLLRVGHTAVLQNAVLTLSSPGTIQFAPALAHSRSAAYPAGLISR